VLLGPARRGADDDFVRAELVDAALVDVAGAGGRGLDVARLARAFPSAGFLGVGACRAADAPAIARCAEFGFVDVLAEGVDDEAIGVLVAAHGFSARFLSARGTPPPALGLGRPIHLRAWRSLVARGGRAVRTAELARSLGVTREHLSRAFREGNALTLKCVMDLVRLLAAAELSRNPGYTPADVARVLGFASAKQLAGTLRRVCRTCEGWMTRADVAALEAWVSRRGTVR
jgi:AraC-like DNA-binding protein